MGLYDTPLPPRPPPKRRIPNSDNDDDDDLPPEAITHRLFQFATNGQEVNDRLPPLQRRLDYSGQSRATLKPRIDWW